MSLQEVLFLGCSAGVVPFWLLLTFAPGARVTERVVHSFLAPALLGVVYVACIGVAMTAMPEGAGFHSLEAVQGFFTSGWAALAGWVHYLVFDLFVGAWEARDARRRGIPHTLLVPCLGLTFMLGPSGLLVYLVIRAARDRRDLALVEQ